MKKVKLILILLLSCIFTACQQDGYKYARNIIFTRESEKFIVCIEYYDFSKESEKFEFVTIAGDNIKEICIDVCRRENMNFRLCENVYISPHLLEDDIVTLFDAMNSIQIPLAVNLWCFNGKDIPENIKNKSIKTHLYDFSTNENKIEGVIAVYDDTYGSNGAVILSGNEIVGYIDDVRWNILSVITGDTKNIYLQIEDENILAKLKNCGVYFSGNKGLIINFTAFLEDFKGVSNRILNEKSLKEILKIEIEKTLYQIYGDTFMIDIFNLYWHKNQSKIRTDNINVNVTIL